MLRRLLALILVACLALPALPAPVLAATQGEPLAQMAMPGHGCHDSAPAKHNIAPKHECIGCIAPLHGIAAPLAGAPIDHGLRNPALSPQLGHLRAGPATPPPRS